MTYGAVSVKVDGGAVGDGATDDTAAFQACAVIGGVILVPEGTYIVDTVTVAVDCEWVGEGNGSVIKKKANTVGNPPSFLFDVTSADVVVGFSHLVFDGNYAAQRVAPTTGGTPANTNGTVNEYDGTATLMAYGGAVQTVNATADAATDRLVLRFSRCWFQNTVTDAIIFQATPDVGARAELSVSDCVFSEWAAGIAQYQSGSGDLPAAGYSFASQGVSPSGITVKNAADVSVTGCTFTSTRDPLAGTLSTDVDMNTFNMPPVALFLTSTVPSETTPEWSSLILTGNRFEGMGRPAPAWNGLGVVDLYVRGGRTTITGNVFQDCWEVPIRAKSNAREMTITGNVIENVKGYGYGISVNPLTTPSQMGRYAINGNVVRGAICGISVVGDNDPPENSDAAIADDPDSRVNNVVISGNIIEDITNATWSDASLSTTFAQNGQGIFVRYASDVLISGNIVRNTDSVGSNATEHGIWARDGLGSLSILGNIVIDTARSGIRADSWVGSTDCSHNQVRTSGVNGIILYTMTGSIVCSHNRVQDAASAGIHVENTGPNTFVGNIVKGSGGTGILAGSSVATRVVATGNVVEDVAVDNSGSAYGIDSGVLTAGSIHIGGNIIDTVANAGAGTAYGIRAAFSAVADTNTAVIEGNTIIGTDESGVFWDKATGIIQGNQFITCNTSGSAINGAVRINGTANTGRVNLVGNHVDATTDPMPTAGSQTLDVMRYSRVIHETGNSWQPVSVTRSAAPNAGTWAVGDVVWDSAPTSGGTIGWVCVTAGTPGTWKAFGAIA